MATGRKACSSLVPPRIPSGCAAEPNTALTTASGESSFPRVLAEWPSPRHLEGVWLSKLNQAANLRRELQDLLEKYVETVAEARFAQWVKEYRELLAETVHRSVRELEGDDARPVDDD